jgi:hypothetical protein
LSPPFPRSASSPRVLEAAIIVAGITSLLAVVTLRQAAAAGADTDSLITTGTALVAIHNWTFLLGPGFIPAVNALLLGSLLYRARLVPRVIPALGLIGAPLLLLSAAAVLFGLHPQVSVLSAMSAVPDLPVGGVARPLAGRQRVQALPPHRCHGAVVNHAGWSMRAASLIAGIALLLMTVLAVFADFAAIEALITPGDAARTAGDITGSETLFRWGVAAFVLVAAAAAG